MGELKTLTINGVVYEIKPTVPAASVRLMAASWLGSGSTYSQVVELPAVTAKSKVDLQPSPEQLEEFCYKHLAFVAENDGGRVTVYSVGDKPDGDHTIQVTLTEMESSGKIRGNTVGTPAAAHVTDNNNPHEVSPAQIGAAPAGYGLGNTAKVVDSLDNAVGNGFYYSENGGPHEDYWYAIVHSYDDSGNWAIQQAWNNIASEVGNVLAVRRKCNGVWHEWEYETPPMYTSKEYRTTERWQAGAVYAQMVEISSLPNNATAAVTINTDNVFAPIDVSVSLKKKSDGVRYAAHPSVSAYLSLAGGVLKANIIATGDMSGYTGYVTVRYVKN